MTRFYSENPEHETTLIAEGQTLYLTCSCNPGINNWYYYFDDLPTIFDVITQHNIHVSKVTQ